MLKLAQLKYPSFPIKVNPTQATVRFLLPCGAGLTFAVLDPRNLLFLE